MKRRAARCLLALAMLPSACAAADDDWAIIAFVNPVLPFRAGEVPRHPAPGGLALTVVDGRCQLMPATRAGRPLSTAPGGDDDLVAIAAKPADAIAYLRLPGLSAGRVDAPDVRFAKGASRDLGDEDLPLPFLRKAWRFEHDARGIWLTDGTRRQRIEGIAEPDRVGNGEAVRLLWAGDLDRDGGLDFILALATDDGVTACVWLSRRAAPGQLAGKAACMDHVY